MGRLDDQCGRRNGGVVRCSRVILPCAVCIPILPLAHRDIRDIRRQLDLRRRHSAAGIVLEQLLTGDPHAFSIQRSLNLAERDVRHHIDRQPVIRIDIGDIAQIGQQAGSYAVQLIRRNRQHAAGNRFAGRKRGFTAGAFLALPCDGQPRGIQRQRGLIGEDHRSQDELGRARPVRSDAATRIGVFDLRLGEIGRDVAREALTIRQVNNADLSRCDNCHMRPPIQSVHSGRMPAAAHPPSLPKCF